MVDQLSPLAAAFRPGRHSLPDRTIGVTLCELQPGSIVQLAAWRGSEAEMIAIIREVSGLDLPSGAGTGSANEKTAAFGFAPGRFLVTDDDEGLAERFSKAVTTAIGTVTDLSHGRTVMRINGPKVEWVLSKFFAIDFSQTSFSIGSGISTVHHDIFTQIQRTGHSQFDLYVFRSFARAFWKSLCYSSEEVGYEVV